VYRGGGDKGYSEVGKIILGHTAQATSHTTVPLLICYMTLHFQLIKKQYNNVMHVRRNDGEGSLVIHDLNPCEGT